MVEIISIDLGLYVTDLPGEALHCESFIVVGMLNFCRFTMSSSIHASMGQSELRRSSSEAGAAQRAL